MTQAERRTRGFLFADLRGYTAFVEAHGDTAAAELLADYRNLVRETVAQFGGAEIKTEGDSFYVVFDAASGAVECGLALVDAAAAASRLHPERPIRVGVGIHAGETIEMDGGYVGSAVNVAARVCSVARAGEVAISETVQGLVRTGLPVHFVPRGTPRLKGIEQPIAIYAVKRGAAPTIPGWRRLAAKRGGPGTGLVVAAVVVAVLASLGGVVLLAGGPSSSSASPSSSVFAGASSPPSPSPSPSAAGPSSTPGATALTSAAIESRTEFTLDLQPGRYSLTDVRPPTDFVISGQGWGIDRASPDGFNLWQWRSAAHDAFVGYISANVVQVVRSGPCEESATQLIGGEAASLVTWLRSNEWLTVTDPLPVNLGGWTGLRVDVSQAKSPKGDCIFLPDLTPEMKADLESRVWLFQFGDEGFFIGPDERLRVLVVDVDGKSFTILAGAFVSDDFDAFIEEAQTIIDSMQFGPS